MGKNWKFNYVYVTTNLIDGKKYIGDHSSDRLNDGYLGSGIILAKAIKKYGRKNFKKEILEFFDTKKEAFDAQIKWINEYNTVRPNGYNISPAGGTQCNAGYSNEMREKISHAVKKRYEEDPSYRERVIKATTGVKQSQETIEKRIRKFRGKQRSEETKRKIGNANRGTKHSEKSRKNMSDAHKGQKAWNKGIPMTEEQKLKISKTLKNRNI